MVDPVAVLQGLFEAGKWLYNNFETLTQSHAEAKNLADRITMLNSNIESLADHLRNNQSLIPVNDKDPLMLSISRVQEFFAQLISMLESRDPSLKKYETGFFSQAKRAFDNARTFFDAEDWIAQLAQANLTITQLNTDFSAAIEVKVLSIAMHTAEGVHRIEDLFQKMHDLLSRSTGGTVARTQTKVRVHDLHTYASEQIKKGAILSEAGASSIVYEVDSYPDHHPLTKVVYKKSSCPPPANKTL
jgi:hypothetical protein